jgi:hypothetical protein
MPRVAARVERGAPIPILCRRLPAEHLRKAIESEIRMYKTNYMHKTKHAGLERAETRARSNPACFVLCM